MSSIWMRHWKGFSNMAWYYSISLISYFIKQFKLLERILKHKTFLFVFYDKLRIYCNNQLVDTTDLSQWLKFPRWNFLSVMPIS